MTTERPQIADLLTEYHADERGVSLHTFCWGEDDLPLFRRVINAAYESVYNRRVAP